MERKSEKNRQINIEYEEDPENEVSKHFVCSLKEAQLPCGPAAGKNLCAPQPGVHGPWHSQGLASPICSWPWLA